MGMFIEGLQKHNARLFESAGIQILYLRGQIEIQLPAVLGATSWADETTDDAYLGIKSVDFIIKPEDLNIAGDLVEPSRGDRIRHAGFDYDLIQTNNGTFWSWSDGFKTFYRVHTSRSNVAS
jgi:hypothetical protein